MVEQKKPLNKDSSIEVKHIDEPGYVKDVTEQKNVELKKKTNIEEIHEKPVLEVREKPIIKNIKEPKETTFVKEKTQYEELGDKKKGEKFIEEQLSKKPETKKSEIDTNVTVKDETPIVKRVDQENKEIHHQPVIHEFHEKPITEVHEQPIVKVVHEQPEMKKVLEKPLVIDEDKNKIGKTEIKTNENVGFNNDINKEVIEEKKIGKTVLPEGKIKSESTTLKQEEVVNKADEEKKHGVLYNIKEKIKDTLHIK